MTANAKGYDSDANDGGSMVDNQTFFRSDGTPLQSLKVFSLVYEGQTVDIKADYLEDQEVYYTVNEGPIELPSTVSVVLNNERRAETEEALYMLQKYTDIECLADITPKQFGTYGRVLKGKIYDRAKHVVKECERVRLAVSAMRAGNIDILGKLLKESHKSLAK